jgi:ABC-type multidrug transport system fused ATPase/permease subunit
VRQLASLWANFQLALAALDRIRKVLSLKNNMPVLPASENTTSLLTHICNVCRLRTDFPGRQ